MVTSIILIRMRRYIGIFRSAGATNISTAIIPEEYGISDDLAFQKMVRQGILIPADRNRYYLDEQRESVIRRRRRKMLAILMAIIFLMLIINAFLLLFKK